MYAVKCCCELLTGYPTPYVLGTWATHHGCNATTCPKMPASGTIAAWALMYFLRNSGFWINAKLKPNPGMLNVLLGAIRVMVFIAISCDNAAVGMCSRPSMIKSQWISSEQITMPFSTHTVAIRSSSARFFNRPVGLCGWQRMHILLRPSIAPRIVVTYYS